jgi:Xaa-Pro aminopeptidase
VGGQPTEAQSQLHRACLAALHAGEQVLRAGVAAADVYAVIHERFREDDQEAYFPHHAGHGIGLSHLELPFLVPESQDVLSVGDVVTIEPGLYKEGVGGMRIERNYLITEAGFEVLSRHHLSLGQIARS